MKILAIETSCDETSAAVIEGASAKAKILSNIVSSQINLHKEYGGVVPEVAARAHIETILPVIKRALLDAKTRLEEIDYICPTYGPGLIGSLLVGVETAKALSLAQNIPIVPVNHLEGHLYANFVSINPNTENQKDKPVSIQPEFPILALIISGGHTMIILVKDHLRYQVVGKTRDDAAGEAFDKAAKIMGLGYPGGPIISKLAEEGDADAYQFPIVDLTAKPYRNEDGFLRYPEPSLDFSFSGLKTALLTKVKDATSKKAKLSDSEVKNLAASFQNAITKNVAQNVTRAIKKYQPKTFIISGGVAANKHLRENLGIEVKKIDPKINYLIPEFSLCTDNAAMIGVAGYFRIETEGVETAARDACEIIATPSLKLEENA